MFKNYVRTNWLPLSMFAVIAVLACFNVIHPANALDLGSPESLAALAGVAGTVARSPTVSAVPTDPVQTGIAIAYKNGRLIADEVMPPVPVGKQEFRYQEYALKDGFTVPDTKVGRRGRTNSAEFGATEKVGMTEDHALEAAVPVADIENAPPGYDPVGHHTMLLTDLVLLGREKRTADKVFGAANYGTNNKLTLSGNDRWSQSASKPITDITEAADSMIMRPNVAVAGRKTFRYLSQHASILKAINRNDGDSGIATKKAIMDLFELDDLLIGEGFLNIAAPGQAPNLVPVWGSHFALLHRNKLANTQGGTTFGFTARWGTWFASTSFDKNQGMRGSQVVRVGESTQQVITANDLGFLLTNAGDDA